MKRYRDADGRLRLWYSDAEIEKRALRCLEAAGQPSGPEPVVDIEFIIEEQLRARLDQYAVLPPGVLGVTDFLAGERPLVRIDGELSRNACDIESPAVSAVGRWRATLAHEAGHIILHTVLFDVPPSQAALLDADAADVVSPKPVSCIERSIDGRRPSDWREVQANRCMAALLMPRPLFDRWSRIVALEEGLPVPAPVDSPAARRLVSRLADRFQVSREAARIRLVTCQLLSDNLPLPLAADV